MPKILILILTILLASCNLPRSIPDLGIMLATDTPIADAGYTECGWNWASRPLLDLSAEVQAALDGAGLTDVTTTVEAFGENCITGTGEVDHFATMETDFHIRMKVPDLADTAALGALLERILVVLDSFPPGTVPGPRPGYIGVRFVHGAQEFNLWFTVTSGKSARARGLHATELFMELYK